MRRKKKRIEKWQWKSYRWTLEKFRIEIKWNVMSIVDIILDIIEREKYINNVWTCRIKKIELNIRTGPHTRWEIW